MNPHETTGSWGGCTGSLHDHGFQGPSEMTRNSIARQLRIEKMHSMLANTKQGETQASGLVAQRRQNDAGLGAGNCWQTSFTFFLPFVREGVIKLDASASSPEGFPSRDQDGR